MELIVVLAILGLLAALVTPRVMGALGKAKVSTTEVQIEQISGALEFFFIDNGRYPTAQEGLEGLVAAPGNLATWNGPYLAKSEVPADGWKRPFTYEPAGKDEAKPYYLYSLGADGRPGGTGNDRDVGRLPGPES